ncbi:membrane protein [Roseibium aquae]|uniref:Membrane protein n=1 Tax=Roseibium aquae TaxID=1323746 RepID=A0A916TGD5_9HYPH|nr:tetratricopeptide repeat protein [Roseibium aquae]GGB42907.1 membrane protein [Roseibium aquae]
MSDIFREVDEDIRREKYRRLWDRFGPMVIAAAVLIVAGTGGYRGWLYWQETKAREAGDQFLEAVSVADAGNPDQALAMLESLNDATGGYPDLARLRMAAELARTDRQAEALTQLDAFARDTSVPEPLRAVAALRAGFIAVDTETYPAVADRVERLTAADNPFRSAAREILALSAWKADDVDTARRWISAIEDDPETPGDTASRVRLLAGLIDARHGPDEQAVESADGVSQ